MKGTPLKTTRDNIRWEIERTQEHLAFLKKALKCKHEKFNPPLTVYSHFAHNCMQCGWKIYT